MNIISITYFGSIFDSEIKKTSLPINPGNTSFFYLLFVFIFVITLAYFTTKYISTSKFLGIINKNMQIIESINVKPNCYLQIVKVANSYILISVTKDRITFLKDIDKDEIILNKESKKPEQNIQKFTEILKKYKKDK